MTTFQSSAARDAFRLQWETLGNLAQAVKDQCELKRSLHHAEHCQLIVQLHNAEQVLLVSRQMTRDTKKLRSEALAKQETFSDPDGWRWPVQIMASGRAHGSVQGSQLPHCFPEQLLPRVAEAANGARFRRRHPGDGEDGNALPELTAGWISDARVSGSAVCGTVNLLKSETRLRETLLAAREADKLDLFGVSIEAMFAFRKTRIDGAECLEATSIHKLFGIDMVGEPGAAGFFLA